MVCGKESDAESTDDEALKGNAMNQHLRFHWRLPQGGENTATGPSQAAAQPQSALPDLEAQAEFCRYAEASGIDSLLTAFGYYMPDPMLLATALGLVTERIKFIVAYRPGLLSPTLLVQQVNTLSALTNGRVSLNIVAGHSQKEQGYYGDWLEHDARYQRAEEFLAICHAFWQCQGSVSFRGTYFNIANAQVQTPFVSPECTLPEIYLGGGSPPAQALAIKYASCWLLLGDHPDNLRARIRLALEQGIEVGLRLSIIARPTRREALAAADALLKAADTTWIENVFVQGSDSMSMQAAFAHAKEAETAWLTPWLWRGAVPAYGASAIALVGTPEEIAAAILAYKSIGISQFILSGWPNLEAVTYFGREILPRIRAREGDVMRDKREGIDTALAVRLAR
jgi:alkanesulfonate monooxygenase